jgi:hypothetical protein
MSSPQHPARQRLLSPSGVSSSGYPVKIADQHMRRIVKRITSPTTQTPPPFQKPLPSQLAQGSSTARDRLLSQRRVLGSRDIVSPGSQWGKKGPALALLHSPSASIRVAAAPVPRQKMRNEYNFDEFQLQFENSHRPLAGAALSDTGDNSPPIELLPEQALPVKQSKSTNASYCDASDSLLRPRVHLPEKHAAAPSTVVSRTAVHPSLERYFDRLPEAWVADLLTQQCGAVDRHLLASKVHAMESFVASVHTHLSLDNRSA